MGSVLQQCIACYALNTAGRAINGNPIVKQPGVTILSPGGVAGSILTVYVSGQISNFMGALIPGLPGNFSVSDETTFRQEGW
jgi:hypothetical protein